MVCHSLEGAAIPCPSATACSYVPTSDAAATREYLVPPSIGITPTPLPPPGQIVLILISVLTAKPTPPSEAGVVGATPSAASAVPVAEHTAVVLEPTKND